MTTIRLKPGDSLDVSGRVTVVKCGTHREGDEPPQPTVLLEVDGTFQAVSETEEEPHHAAKRHKKK